MSNSISAIVRDPETGEGLPNQSVKLRISPFTSDLYTMTDEAGKPGGYVYNGDYDTAKYKLWVNGVEDKSFGGDHGKHIPNIDQLLLKSGGAMTGAISMGNNKITDLDDPTSDDDAVNKGFADINYLNKSGDTMEGTLDMDFNLLRNLPGPEEGTDAINKEFGDITYLRKEGDTMEGPVDMDGHELFNLPAPSGGTSPVRRDDGDGRYIRKEPGVTNQNVYAPLTFFKTPFILNEPTNAREAVNQMHMKNYVTKVLLGFNPTAYQQSSNIIRVIYSGLQEDGKVYTTMTSAITEANSISDSSHHMTIKIAGNGIGVEPVADRQLPEANSAEDYVHIQGDGEGIKLFVEDTEYTGTTLPNVIGNLTLDNENDTAETTFNNKIFYDVKFMNLFGNGSYVFNDCFFFGGCSIEPGVGYTFNDCIGSVYDIDLDQLLILGGMKIFGDLIMGGLTVIDNVGDVRPRRLQGRKGSDITAALTITAGDGNFFVVNGTTTIQLMLNTGWEAGSIVTLQFADSVTIEHGVAGIGPEAGFWFKDALDRNASPPDTFSFILNSLKTLWIEI